MWINKAEYESLKELAKDNEYDANMFRNLIKYLKEKKTIFHDDFVIINYNTWEEISNKYNTSKDRIKDIEAELAWYKTKYHEMKIDKKATKIKYRRIK